MAPSPETHGLAVGVVWARVSGGVDGSRRGSFSRRGGVSCGGVVLRSRHGRYRQADEYQDAHSSARGDDCGRGEKRPEDSHGKEGDGPKYP